MTCYWQDADGRRPVRSAARCCNAAEFVGYVWALACRCGLLRAAVCIVDWYHAVQHLWDAGRVLYGEGTEATQRWVERCTAWLAEGRVDALLRRLKAQRARSRSPARREALRGLIGYVEKPADRMDYGRFRAMGLDIGSGCVESACKHVVGSRLKRSGMRWSRAGCQAVLSLRTTWLNGQWKTFWAQHRWPARRELPTMLTHTRSFPLSHVWPPGVATARIMPRRSRTPHARGHWPE